MPSRREELELVRIVAAAIEKHRAAMLKSWL